MSLGSTPLWRTHADTFQAPAASLPNSVPVVSPSSSPAVTPVQEVPARPMTARTQRVSCPSSQLHVLSSHPSGVLTTSSLNAPLLSLLVDSPTASRDQLTRTRPSRSTSASLVLDGRVCTTPRVEDSRTWLRNPSTSASWTPVRSFRSQEPVPRLPPSLALSLS